MQTSNNRHHMLERLRIILLCGVYAWPPKIASVISSAGAIFIGYRVHLIIHPYIVRMVERMMN